MVLMNKNASLMKRGVVLLLAVVPVLAFSQKLKRSEFDKNTSQWRIESFPAILKSSGDAKLSVAVQAADTVFSLQLTGSGKGTNTVDEGSRLEMLLDNDSTVFAFSPSVQSLEYGQTLATYRHYYRIPGAGLEQLSRHNLRAIRKYSIGGYDDIFVEQKNAAKLKETAGVFLSEWKVKNGVGAAITPVVASLAPARFPGGDATFLSFINRNLQPQPALVLSGKKTAVVALALSADGSITEMRLQQSVGTTLDDELVRILRRMPRWKPAVKDGKPIESTVTKTINIWQKDGNLIAEL